MNLLATYSLDLTLLYFYLLYVQWPIFQLKWIWNVVDPFDTLGYFHDGFKSYRDDLITGLLYKLNRINLQLTLERKLPKLFTDMSPPKSMPVSPLILKPLLLRPFVLLTFTLKRIFRNRASSSRLLQHGKGFRLPKFLRMSMASAAISPWSLARSRPLPVLRRIVPSFHPLLGGSWIGTRREMV